tara:strand:+ start:810 stop:1211 length:402 start_codon:yes stop_codon:yes gene_type:complete
MKNTVAAKCIFTVVSTGVLIIVVAVIASFLTYIKNAVAASCLLTGVSTGILIVRVPVIAGLTGLDDPIATTLLETGLGAAIIAYRVPIITFFAPVRSDNAITASVFLTDVAASIFPIDLIPIVAGFITGFSRT